MPIQRPLTPTIAAALSAEVYRLVDQSGGAPFNPTRRELDNAFDFSRDGGNIRGRTGAMFWHRDSGFAVIGRGKAREYEGSVAIGFRGSKILHDFLSNSHTRTTTVDNGTSAHQGFYRSFLTMQPTLKNYLDPLLRGKSNFVVHCSGHSLGAALAQLAAIWIKKFYGNPVALYTFGAPRVGLRDHAMQTPVCIDQIYRCVHGDDPVPMVPVWPYYHAPYQGAVVQLNKDPGIRVSAHNMSREHSHSYENSVAGLGWDPLIHRELSFSAVYLRYDDRGRVTQSEYWKRKIWDAITTILRQSGAGGAAVMGAQNLTGGLNTFYDTVAVALEQAATLSSAMADHVKGLLGHMLVFAEMGRDLVISLTRSFIRRVFRRVLAVLERIARQALPRL